MRNRIRDFLAGVGLCFIAVLVMGAIASTTIYRGKFVGDGSGLWGVSAAGLGGTNSADGSSLWNVHISAANIDTNSISPARVWNTWGSSDNTTNKWGNAQFTGSLDVMTSASTTNRLQFSHGVVTNSAAVF